MGKGRNVHEKLIQNNHHINEDGKVISMGIKEGTKQLVKEGGNQEYCGASGIHTNREGNGKSRI